MEILGRLALTHSSRHTNMERCSAQFLKERFGRHDRLDNLPPFESLSPATPLYSGAVSFWGVSGDQAGELRVEMLGLVKHRDKIQHAVFVGDRELLVGYEHRIELWSFPRPVDPMARIGTNDVSVRKRFEHPHLAGLHTVAQLADGQVLASCSAADAVLICNLDKGTARTLRMPTRLYGHNYDLTPETDLRKRYIPDNCQTTHVNAASVDKAGRRAVVSALIPGAIGVFDLRTGDYAEATRGYVGCHGARFFDGDRIYFADSTRGALVFLAPDGSEERRVGMDSLWLHDVCRLHGSVYALAAADSNELRIYDIDRERILFQHRFPVRPFDDSAPVPDGPPEWLGNSTQALSYAPDFKG